MKVNFPHVVQRSDGMVFLTTSRIGQVLKLIRHGGSFSASSIAYRLGWTVETALRVLRVLVRYRLVMLVSHGVTDYDNLYGETPYSCDFETIHLSVNADGRTSTAEHGMVLQFEDGKIVVCAPTAASVIESFHILPGLTHADHTNICGVANGLVSQISEHLVANELAIKTKEGGVRTNLTMTYYVVKPLIRLTDDLISSTRKKKKAETK